MTKNKTPFRQHRFLFHPIFSKLSRIIFITFGCAALVYGGVLYFLMRRYMAANGVFSDIRHAWLLEVMMSSWFALTFALMVGIMAAGLISHHINGPVERIQDWLRHWQHGNVTARLSVRNGDPYENIIQLLNELIERIEKRANAR